MSKSKEALPHLEAALTEITQLVDQMEHGDLSLEQALSQFERGMTLVKHCQKTLEEAEQKVKILLQRDDQETLSPYDSEKSE
jgi:exodeoxyribonuclease VII small subunit